VTSLISQSRVRLPSGTVVSYYFAGDRGATTVMLLHGGGVDHALLSWQDTIAPLVTAGYYVIAPDHPGYGLSPMPTFAVTMANLNRYLAEFIDKLGLRDIAIAGVSMGGAMALGYSLAAPNNVRSLVLVGSYGLQDKSPAHFVSYVVVRIPGLLSMQQRLLTSSRWLRQQSVRQIVRHQESLTPELLAQVSAAAGSSTRAFTQFQRDEVRFRRVRTNFTERLAEVSQPTLIVHGSRDTGVPVAAARRAAEKLPHGRLVVCEGAGHWTQRDVPDQFNRLLLQHLPPP
jgi:pimeloyl-ACP methyl ester carboxylesterase